MDMNAMHASQSYIFLKSFLYFVLFFFRRSTTVPNFKSNDVCYILTSVHSNPLDYWTFQRRCFQQVDACIELESAISDILWTNNLG
jgi:hypothetical protein